MEKRQFLRQVVLGKQTDICKPVKFEHTLTLYTKINVNYKTWHHTIPRKEYRKNIL